MKVTYIRSLTKKDSLTLGKEYKVKDFRIKEGGALLGIDISPKVVFTLVGDDGGDVELSSTFVDMEKFEEEYL